jgi:hypothetical protein
MRWVKTRSAQQMRSSFGDCIRRWDLRQSVRHEISKYSEAGPWPFTVFWGVKANWVPRRIQNGLSITSPFALRFLQPRGNASGFWTCTCLGSCVRCANTCQLMTPLRYGAKLLTCHSVPDRAIFFLRRLESSVISCQYVPVNDATSPRRNKGITASKIGRHTLLQLDWTDFSR